MKVLEPGMRILNYVLFVTNSFFFSMETLYKEKKIEIALLLEEKFDDANKFELLSLHFVALTRNNRNCYNFTVLQDIEKPKTLKQHFLVDFESSVTYYHIILLCFQKYVLCRVNKRKNH